MTRKDVEAIARVLRKNAERAYTTTEKENANLLANDMADMLATTNENFKKNLFLLACRDMSEIEI